MFYREVVAALDPQDGVDTNVLASLEPDAESPFN